MMFEDDVVCIIQVSEDKSSLHTGYWDISLPLDISLVIAFSASETDI